MGIAEPYHEVLPFSTWHRTVVVCGTCGISWENSIKFYTLGSVSRGIPWKEWDITLEGLETKVFTFYPESDIIAIAEEVEVTWT